MFRTAFFRLSTKLVNGTGYKIQPYKVTVNICIINDFKQIEDILKSLRCKILLDLEINAEIETESIPSFYNDSDILYDGIPKIH